jgi:heme exporter protein A
MLEARLLECVRGHRQLFHDLSFSVQPGDYVELRGPNGSGKTSLLRILCGLLPATSGVVLWRGEPTDTNRESYLSSVTYVGHRCAVKDELTVLENLRLSTALSGCDLSPEEARNALERVHLIQHEHTHARFLSEGQHRRLALARLVACNRPLWLLDEVLASLDAEADRSIRDVIHEHVTAGGMTIVATHQNRPVGIRVACCIELAA